MGTSLDGTYVSRAKVLQVRCASRAFRRTCVVRLEQRMHALHGSTSGATCTGTVEDPTDVRPIAIGSCIRRLAEKTLLRRHREAIIAHFAPLQVAVAVPNGTELVAKAVQVLLDAN